MDGLCIIDCAFQPDACAGQTVTCPPGFDCEIDCADDGGCDAATINCPESYKCDVKCDGDNVDACKDVTVNCSASGECTLTCDSDNDCPDAGTQLICGNNTCVAGCNISGTVGQSCGGSCDCQNNGC